METKLIVSFFMMLGSSFSSFAQEDLDPVQVPSVVMNTLKSMWPEAYAIEWEKKGKKYEAEFEVNGADYKAQLDEAGKIVAHYYEIPSSSLPQTVTSTLSRDYASYTVEDVKRIEKNGTVYYKVELDGSLIDRDIIFTAAGEATNKIVGF
jgi:uncharacterized membrane protein YkoI